MTATDKHTLFTRRYSDGLAVTVRWYPDPGYHGFGHRGELVLSAERESNTLGRECYSVDADNLVLREERTTSITNEFVGRARDWERVACC